MQSTERGQTEDNGKSRLISFGSPNDLSLILRGAPSTASGTVEQRTPDRVQKEYMQIIEGAPYPNYSSIAKENASQLSSVLDRYEVPTYLLEAGA